MEMKFRRVDWEFSTPFRIAYRTRTHAQTVSVELREFGCVGRGEALGVSYHGETVETLLDQLASLGSDVANCVSTAELQSILPPGGVRNAVDCALWDLAARQKGCRAWELAGLRSVRPLVTAYTLGVDLPEAMGRAAAAASRYPLLKLKLTGHFDLECVSSVREARPDAELIVDANQAWGEPQLHELIPQLAELGVKLIEQPLPTGKDEVLARLSSPIPLCADESCQATDSLAALAGKYEYVNIKLDKTGGLTEALRLARAAKEQRFKLMIGCMGGSSLSMAPAFIVGQLCDVVDLDGPLLAKDDVPNGIRYEGGRMFAPEVRLWG